MYLHEIIIGIHLYKIFVPNLSLAFEYNGEQHYINTAIYTSVEKTQQRDLFKKTICKDNGITLIVIPYWWSRKIESVVNSIHVIRPDITLPSALQKESESIPTVEVPIQPQQRQYHPKRATVPNLKLNI